MSHISKNSNIFFMFFKITRLLMYIFILSSIVLSILSYKGNTLYLIIYSLLINLVLLNSFKKKSTFFETFFGVFLWLGFWFKLVFIIVFFNDHHFREGVSSFYDTANNKLILIDETLLISSLAFLAYLLACFTKDKLFSFVNLDNNHIKPYRNNSIFFKLQKYIIPIFVFFIVFVVFFNLDKLIYQRGMISQSNYNYFINGSIKWLLLFGFSSIFSILIYYNIFKKRNLYFLSFISLIEVSMSNISYLSRASIFNSLSIFYGIYKSNKTFKLNLSIKYFIIYFITILILFFVTVSTVNFLRTYYYIASNDEVKIKYENKSLKIYSKKNQKKIKEHYNNIPRAITEFYSLAINRWVGIDSMLAVTSHQDKNMNLFIDSLKENYDPARAPFYERVIQERTFNLNNKIYGIKTPGIIAFLFYSGSIFFLFISIYTITLISIYFENYLLKKTNNPIFCSIIMQVIAYRLIHFGYLPKQSYLLFGAIFLTLLIHIIFDKIFKDR